MASVTQEITIIATPDEVWDALRDWPAIHTRLARGFVEDARVEGRDGVITMFNGIAVRERIVTVDDERRRLVWSIVDGPYAHHNASAQVLALNGTNSRFIWTADFLPDEVRSRIEPFMERGINAIKQTLEAAAK